MAQAKPSGVRINVSGTRYSIGEKLLPQSQCTGCC